MPVSAFEKLSDMIQSRVQDNRKRKQQAEDQARNDQMSVLMTGAMTRAQYGKLSDDQFKQFQEQMQKLVPKDSIPLIEGLGKVINLVNRKRKQSGEQSGGQAGQSGQAATTQAPLPSGQSVDPGMILRPANTNLPQNTPRQGLASQGQAATPNGGQPGQSPSADAPTAPTAQNPPAPKPPMSMFLSSTDMGTAAGEQQVAQEQVIRQDRMASAEAANKWYESQGKTMPEGERQAMQLWAITGHFPPAAFGRTKMHPVTVMGENGELVPALQVTEGDDVGKVIGANGQEIENPKIASKWKPGRGWAKDDKGKFFSFAIDPATNQPIKGTEDYSALPPSQYLDHYKEGMYYWTDDSGNVHATPNPTRTGVVTSGSGTPMGKGTPNPNAPAVPSFIRGPGKKSSGASARASSGGTTAAKSKSGGGSGDRVVGTKDTGVLNSPAQTVITKTQPVLDQVDRLVSDIDRLGLQDNNDSGYLFTSMMKYKFGKASPDGSLGNDIAGLSLGSVVEAASALGGTSRSLTALKKALQHTPNPWVDSPKLMREKLVTIKERLQDIVHDANEYGRKRQPSTSGAASVPANMRGPQSQLTPDQEAEQYLSK